MKKFLIVANWKMNPTKKERVEKMIYFLEKKRPFFKNIELIVAPPFLYFYLFLNKKIKISAQNCFWEEKGAFTGEISPLMLKDFNCQYVILGHSERKNFLKEDNQMINKKLKIVLKNKIFPILCFGEKEIIKNEKKRNAFLKKEIEEMIKGIGTDDLKKIIFAYEPVFAIGKEKACDFSYAKSVLDFLKKNFENRILYGGSVNQKNLFSFLKLGFDGVLIGHFSLKIKQFLKTLENLNF